MSLCIKNKYIACLEAIRLLNLSELLFPVYASSTAKVFPYQLLAARFALRSDFLKGCILCDEASLGKTYEALLVAGQKWFEGKERILIIVPPSLISQWIVKVEKDFTLPIVFWNNTKEIPKKPGIKITTYNVAERYYEKIKEINWDLIIFDEADILSNPTTERNIKLKEAAGDAFKLLLTPTPITLSIMDIYGLIHFIDESVLPDADWFYKRYFRKPENYQELTNWVSQFCFRTLKVQITDYVNFSRRLPITIDYPIQKEEQIIYKLINSYIVSDNKIAYPKMDNYNLSLMFFKKISSSPQAFIELLENPIKRAYGFEKQTLAQIKEYCSKIERNSKTVQLLKILKTVFKHLTSMKVNKKAIIFVDNNTTRWELTKIFMQEGYNTIKYEDTYSIERFREDKKAEILITTDETAKGLDIEFCPVVVNYDFPYDIVKLEQRICRCHRQGQKSDVLVINLLSKENFADVRILELINKRTLQFNGIFGMSDDIVGNFDIKIKEILKNFRHRDEVAQSFKDNLSEHKQDNEELVKNTENVLFTSFNPDVVDKVHIAPKYIEEKTEELNNDLWEIIKYHFTYATKSYKVDEKERTLNRIMPLESEVEEDNNIETISKKEFAYYTNHQCKYHKARNKYGMSKDLPYYERLTFTSPLVKSILNKYKDCGIFGSVMYTDKVSEIYEVILYNLNYILDSKYIGESNILIGQNRFGKIMDEEKCRELLDLLPIKIIEPRTCMDASILKSFENDFNSVPELIKNINVEEVVQTFINNKQGSFDFAINKIKLTAEKNKYNYDLRLEKLKNEIKELRIQTENEKNNNFENLEKKKQIKDLEEKLKEKQKELNLRKQEIDANAQREIAKLQDINKYQISTREKFHIYIYPSSALNEV